MLKIIFLVAFILFFSFLYFPSKETQPLTPFENNSFRGDTQFAIDNCYKLSNKESNIFVTAAGFKLNIPKWVKIIHHVFQFNKKCELTDIQFYFLISDSEVLPKAHSQSGHPNYQLGFNTTEWLTAMVSFRKPRINSQTPKNACSNKEGVIEYPEYNLVICPYLKAEKNKNLEMLPYFPIFQFGNKDKYIATLTCSHSQLKEYSADNLVELDVKYPCRGHWKWRAGAYIMFDISRDYLLKNTYESLINAEKIINSWVVEKT